MASQPTTGSHGAGRLDAGAPPSHVPELLAPAGGWSQLKAAVRFGADAVYVACDKFGMRARADNFALDEMGDVVAFAHDRGCRVHVALNTLMDGRDIKVLPGYMEQLADAGCDAFIIGDLGALSLAKRHAPSVEVHVSTQASVMNAESARMWHDLGASRVVCAREMSVEDIAQLRADAPADLELEAFVHGAMCVAYSGRCLLSSVMTGRTANKGACAQSCRWSYALVEEKRPGEYFEIEEDTRGSFILNAQDLNMVSHLDDLARAGVCSFKIEGRNKRAFYVATVVRAYRSVLDGGDAEAAERELRTISHRPYSTGFYYGRANQTCERDGYVRDYVHVATVEDCRELTADDDGWEPFANAGSLVAGQDSPPILLAINESKDVPSTHLSGGVGRGASGLDAPARWLVTASCHNRFEHGDELGIVAPFEQPRTLRVGQIRWLAPADGGKPFVERPPLSLEEVRAQSVEQPVSVANRSKERYVFVSDAPVHPGDYLRRRA